MNVPKIKFDGHDLLFFADTNHPGTNAGSLVTKEDIENFRPGYAHCNPDEKIIKAGEIIGNYSDIEFTGEEEYIDMVKVFMALWKQVF